MSRDRKFAEALEVSGVPNCHRVSDRLYRGGQPTAEGLLELKKLGVKTLLSLRAYHSDGKLGVQKAGLDFEHIPVKTWGVDEEAVARFLRVATDRRRGPVFVHCQHGADRTGVMCAAWRMAVEGWDHEDAVREMVDGGFGYHKRLWRHLEKFVRALDVAGLQAAVDSHRPRAAGRKSGPRRILVLSAAVGAGHMRAAEAVAEATRELDPEAVVKNVDVLTLTNATFRKLYSQAYLELVNTAPHVLGYVYDLFDRPPGVENALRDRLRLLMDRLNLKPLLALLHEEPWDCVVNTHFLPAEIIAGLRSRGEGYLSHMTVTTDFETHRLWVNQPCDHYFTATGEGAAYLASWGVPARDITATGIPIHPVFSRLPPREECLKAWGLPGERPVVLQLSGGFGVGPIERIFGCIVGLEQPLEVVVVTGRNEELKKRLEAFEAPRRHKVVVTGFTTKIHELMRAADVVVSKPGGLTTSEVLACGSAMVVVNPIPGQEARNSDYLLEEGAAIKVNNLPTLGYKLGALLRDPKRLARIKERARQLGKPEAAFEIGRRALAWAD